MTLADLFLALILFWLEKTPEVQAALPNYPALARWYDRLSGRPRFQAPIPGAAAA
jgi:glutathione S-transferase